MWLIITLTCANALCSVASIEQSPKNCKEFNAPFDGYHSEATYCVHLKAVSPQLKLKETK